MFYECVLIIRPDVSSKYVMEFVQGIQEVIEKSGGFARYALSPVTGKKHQLRVHMNALGLPILNDRMYPPVAQTPDDDYSLPLQLLAKSIAFTDPVTGQARHFQSQRTLA